MLGRLQDVVSMDTQTKIKFKEMLLEQMTHVGMSHYLEGFEYSKQYYQNASPKAD